MKIDKFLNGYVSKKGNPVFVHSIIATKDELANLKASNAPHKESEEGLLVFLSDRHKEGTELRITQNGQNLYAVTELQPKAIQAATNSMSALNNMLNSGVTINPLLVQMAFGAR